MADNQSLSFEEVHQFVDSLFGGNLHAKRVLSLANATLGVIAGASLAVGAIGQGLALARGLSTKHATKQVDRLLSNIGIDIDDTLRRWVPYIVGARTSIPAPASMSPWTGPTSTATNKPRSCCPCSPRTAGRRR